MTELPPNVRRRYGRQIRLSEIGEAGQAKLCEAEASLGGSGFARVIEARYVGLAGMHVVDGEVGSRSEGSTTPSRIDVESLGLRHAETREVAEGALRALVAIRATLGVTKPE